MAKNPERKAPPAQQPESPGLAWRSAPTPHAVLPPLVESVPTFAALDLNTLAVEVRRRAAAPAEGTSEAVRSSPFLQIADAARESWQAMAGFAISVQPLREAQTGDLERQFQVLGYLLALPDELQWSIQLRMLADGRMAAHRASRVGRAHSEACLLLEIICSTAGPSEASALCHLHELIRAVEFAGRLLGGPYRFVPLTRPADLDAALARCPVADIVEIRRSHRAMPSPTGTLGVAVPLPRRAALGRWLSRALVDDAGRRQNIIGWIVTLESARDATVASDRLRTAAAQAAALCLQANRGITAQSDHSAVEFERARRAEAVSQAFDLQWRVSAGLCARVQAFLVADDGGVPPWVVAAAIAECSENGTATPDGTTAPATWRRPVRPGERLLARVALTDVQCLDWEAAGAGSNWQDLFAHTPSQSGPAIDLGAAQRSLALLADPEQAFALFWLPVPSAAGLPGLHAQPVGREVWLANPPRPDRSSLLLGTNVTGDGRQPVYLPLDDRRRHVYYVGQTGTGKSTQLLDSILQDLQRGMGVGVLDPHGDLIEDVLARMPRERVNDVIVIDPSDRAMPVGFNFLECTDDDDRHQLVESFIGILYQLFDPNHTGIIGPRFEHAARNAMLTAMSGEGMTLIEVVRVLTDDGFVRKLLPRVEDPMVRRYWTDQIANTASYHRSEVLDWLVSKFSPFVHNPLVRNIVGQSRSTFSLRQTMDEGKVLLVNLAQGRLGAKLSTFLGMVLVPRILHAAFSRTALPESRRRDFALYVDEFQHYATPAFAEILSGARKYRLNLTMAHQHVAQLPTDVRAAIFGNVATIVALRVGAQDAALLAEAMQPSAFTPGDFVALPNFRAIAQVLVGGQRSACFSLATCPPPEGRDVRWGRSVRARSRRRYGRLRADVEREIAARADLGARGSGKTA